MLFWCNTLGYIQLEIGAFVFVVLLNTFFFSGFLHCLKKAFKALNVWILKWYLRVLDFYIWVSKFVQYLMIFQEQIINQDYFWLSNMA